MTIQMKATEQHFPVVLFTMLYKVVQRMRMVYYLASDTGILRKRKSECSYLEWNLSPSHCYFGCSTLRCRKLVGIKAVKLGGSFFF